MDAPNDGGPPISILPAVGRIQGCILTDRGPPKSSSVRMQYTDLDGQWREVRMPFLDAMYLLNLLRAAQKDMKFEMPEEPLTPPKKPLARGLLSWLARLRRQ